MLSPLLNRERNLSIYYRRLYPRELLILLTITSPRRGEKRRRRRIEHTVSLVERITYLGPK